MTRENPLPDKWLLSDARNDHVLKGALDRLPAGSGFVFRHYHLAPAERAARFAELAARARASGHAVVLAGKADLAAGFGADGVYGNAASLAGVSGLLRLGTAHSAEELQAANAAEVDAVFVSPVFATRSHPHAATLGVHGFHVLARQSAVPVIALGGMNEERARELDWPRWGAIDGLA